MAHDHLLTVEQACEELGIKEHTFYKYRRQYPYFRTVKLGRRTYMRREALDKFIERLEEEQSK